MTLVEICQKLENMLNGLDAETIGVSPANEKYFFRVYSEGLYLTTIADKVSGKNFIPVIVGSLGGEYNPVPNLEEADYNVNIQLFFPVRFKDDFYQLNKFLMDNFVGQIKTYGTSKALSNISVAQYGELQNIDLKEFDKWITNTYKVVNPYMMDVLMSMSFTLYLSTAKNIGSLNGFIYGNSWNTTLKVFGYYYPNYLESSRTYTPQQDYTFELPYSGTSVDTNSLDVIRFGTLDFVIQSITTSNNNFVVVAKYVGDSAVTSSLVIYYKFIKQILNETSPIFVTQTDVSQIEPNAEQLLNTNYARGIPSTSTYTKELPIYIKNNDDYATLIQNYLERDIQNMKLSIYESCSFVIDSAGTQRNVYKEKTYYVLSLSLLKQKGELLGLTFTLGDSI